MLPLLMAFLVTIASSVMAPAARAQGGGGAGASPSPRASARLDLTGYWVAYVTEDWRFRMITPRKGDYGAVPMTPEARRIADAWDPAADQRSGDPCRWYGAAAIMRVPGRLHITWLDDNTLRVDTDAGTQTRLFAFGPPPAAPGPPTWQGRSAAQWEKPEPVRGGGTPPRGGALKVVTANMRGGYLRRNGVPYTENAVLTEYFDVGSLPAVGQVLVVTSIVEDPRYLLQPFMVTSHFKKETDGSRWDPTPCSSKW